MAAGGLYSRNPCEHLDFFGCHFSVMTWRIVSPVLLSVGLCGNFLSFLVFCRKRMRNTSASVYLRLLGVFDSLVLLTSVLRNSILNYSYLDIRTFSDFLCRFETWISSCSRQVAIWLLCAIAIDRLVLIKHPIWAKQNCTKKNSLFVGIVMTSVLFILDLPMFVFYHREEVFWFSKDDNTTTLIAYRCTTVSEGFRHFLVNIKSVLILLLFSIAPVICLIYCNIILLKELKKRHNKRVTRHVNINSKIEQELELRSVTKMLVTICVFFIIITVPGCIYLVLEPYVLDKTVAEEAALSKMFNAILACVLYSNNTFNFILYCVSGKLFRKELSHMIKGIKLTILKRMNRRIHPKDETDESPRVLSGYTNANTKLSTVSKGEFITEEGNAIGTSGIYY